ncbi:carbonic anhydrase [Aurantimonas sp. 22II-16-19i]|uniref:carbonic anhydrase n=1 Tax=Aurantimonas sp. 22II-16-19i TaxID=1317114 RepID=UPI0009F7FFA3|nr:carbonic anhydrase [Aurantimonas sp. 22II-16-19i]ORE94927.1 carbonic anhydrase [Aurantimonas sp. 22II-16-19i]
MTQLLPEHLMEGYKAFIDKRLPGEKQRFRELAEQGQHPKTMVIACCDSRTAPETLFDCGPGDIFVVRNVANLVPPYEPDGEYHSTSAALEFAVHVLEVKHIVILGHGNCGGIHAALSPSAQPLSPGDFIGKWMSLLDPAARAVGANELMTGRERQSALERIAIRYSLANLRSFPSIAALEAEGRLSLHGAWVDISSGELWAMDPDTGDFAKTIDE